MSTQINFLKKRLHLLKAKQWGYFKLQYCIIFMYCVLCFFSTSVQANYPDTTCQVQITQQHVAKAIGADGTQRPVTDWQPVTKLPDYIESRWKNYSGSVWYKIEWHYHCETEQKLPITLVINSINMAGQIYINDELLWQDYALVEPLSRSWNMPRYWNIPRSSIKSGHNVVWIRVISVATQSSGLGKVFLGNPQDVMPHYQKFWIEQRALLFFNLIFSLTLGVVALLVWLFRQQETVFGWFALTSLMWVLLMTNVLMLDSPFGLHTLTISRISTVIFFSYCVFSCFYSWRLARCSFPKLEKVLLSSVVVFIFMAIFTPTPYLEIFLVGGFILSTLIILSNFLSYPFIAYQSKQIEAYLLAVVLLFYCVVVIHDLLYILGISNGFSWAAYTAPLTTLFMALILAMRLAKNIRKIEQFSQTLSESVIQAKNELKSSLTTQHNLELENIKLQERMHLAHDLHDSLGGSLVRSIAIVDQSSENLSNQQFLSMLKILRDDLRQIIDTGSSSGHTPPDTPQIWGAAIRYRFNQIFDEFNIHSEWHLPATWQIQVSSLECLTLLRVIEESLTNVIKHSNATHVMISLSFDQQCLILEIADDGIGFDASTVFQSGMSIGLRSMQIRLEKIHAKLIIASESGCTSIKVIKHF